MINFNEDSRTNKAWPPYALAALLLLVLLFLLSLARSRTEQAVTQQALGNLRAGDVGVKVYLFNKSDVYLTQALTAYEKAAEAPSPISIRRAGIVSASKHKGGMMYFDRLTSKKVLKGKSKQEISDLKSELAMWKSIYKGKPSPQDAKVYAARFERLHLGPTKWLALQYLYDKTGQKKLAAKALRDGYQHSVDAILPAGILFLIVGVAGLAGLVILIMFLSRQTPENTRAADSDEIVLPGENPFSLTRETVPSAVLFQGFVAYLSTFLVVALIGALFLRPILVKNGTLTEALLQFGATALVGLVSFCILNYLIKRSGYSLRDIGFTLKDFGKNVLWGIGGCCALLPLLFFATILWNVFLKTFFKGVETPPNPVDTMLQNGNSFVYVLLLTLAVVFAPFFEELFFRGVLYNALRTRLGVVASVVISASAFALLHPFPAGFLPIFTVGSVFAVLMETRRSLVPSMVAHAIYNGTIFAFAYFVFLK